MTTVAQILDAFFSPASVERLWVMAADDDYTDMVKNWQPVINAMNRAKANLIANCRTWQTNHRTDPSWVPRIIPSWTPENMRTNPFHDRNAYVQLINSPPGTDATTCATHYALYLATSTVANAPPSALDLLLLGPRPPVVQTQSLHRCAIGGFWLYTTVNSIDCGTHDAEISFWMHNIMSEYSFGSNAELFPGSGMQHQHMWWNWTEAYSWSPGDRPSSGFLRGERDQWH